MVFPGYTTVVDVQKDSPAERAGMQAGDRVLQQDGHDLVADPPAQPSLAGDTVQLLVLRGEATVPLTVVLGRWDPPEGEDRLCVLVDPVSSGR
ncbi:MAG TPA: PDZ domain-containing protein [Longimicrobium sp.]|nr:PDZ domain-containing protein [Longimicrobium sp.]